MKDLVFSSYERDLRQLRLARIQNGKHPDYADGHAKSAEKTGKRGCDHKFVGSKCCAKCGWSPG